MISKELINPMKVFFNVSRPQFGREVWKSCNLSTFDFQVSSIWSKKNRQRNDK